MMEDTGMAQVKKAIVRDAIMRAAFDLFSQKDYAATSLVDIAREAGVSPASLYVYFPSKLNLFWAVLQPWLVAQMDKLESQIPEASWNIFYTHYGGTFPRPTLILPRILCMASRCLRRAMSKARMRLYIWKID